MASTGKKKTTMAKRDRENRLRARRLEKQAKKVARKQASALDPEQASAHDPGEPDGTPTEQQAPPDAAPDEGGSSAVAGVAHEPADAS